MIMSNPSDINEVMKTKAHRIIQEIEEESFNEGFKAGWYAATKQINEALKKPIIPPFKHTSEASDTTSGNPFKPSSGQFEVYEYMKSNPGLKGKDIISALSLLDIKHKTVRNAFHRLKDKGLAMNEDGWRVL